MAIRRTSKSFVLKLPTWQDDSFWELRSERNGQDDEILTEMTSKQIDEGVNWTEIRKAYGRGEDVDELIAESVTTETKMSATLASLVHFTVTWGGPDFTLPDDFYEGEEFGREKIVRDQKGKPKIHPLAGSVMPITPEFVQLIDSQELKEATRALLRHHSGRSDKSPDADRGSAQDRLRRSSDGGEEAAS